MTTHTPECIEQADYNTKRAKYNTELAEYYTKWAEYNTKQAEECICEVTKPTY